MAIIEKIAGQLQLLISSNQQKNNLKIEPVAVM